MADVLGAVRLSRMVDESTSPERQREQIQTWAKLHGHQVVHIAEDTDVSGAIPSAQRPQLGLWLTDPSLSGRWTHLVAAKLDRVTRSVSDLCALIDYCQRNDKVLVSIAESFDLGTPAGRMVATILASVAAFERERTAERRREAADWLRTHARYGGGTVPFGYQPQQLASGGWHLVPDDEEAALIREIASQVIAGKSVTALCAELTERGVVTSRGRAVWHNTSLSAMLRSPILIGQIPWKGGVVRGADGVIVRREPILTDETWARLQAALSRASIARTGRRSSAMIGVMFCGLCDSPLYLQRRTDRPTLFYRCGGRRTKHCSARMIPAGPIEELLTSGLLEACGDLDMADEVPVPRQDRSAELGAVEEALTHMEDALVGGDVSPEAWGRAVARLEKRQAELKAEIEALPGPGAAEWVLTGKTFAQTWDGLDPAGRRALLVANNIRVRAERRVEPCAEDVSIPIRFHDLANTEESRDDVLILTRGDLRATIQLGNLDRLRKRLAKLSA